MAKNRKSDLGVARIAPGLLELVRPVEELREDPRNAREHSERNLSEIGRSLKTFGQQTPIVVTEDGVILKGNGTYRAACQLGWEHIAAVTSDLEEKGSQIGFAVMDNRSGDVDVGSTFDEQVLGGLAADVVAEGLEVEIMGFTPEELDFDPIEIDLKPRVKISTEDLVYAEHGDVVKMGPHQVVCGEGSLELSPAQVDGIVRRWVEHCHDKGVAPMVIGWRGLVEPPTPEAS